MIRAALLVAVALGLSACATTRLHSQGELNQVAASCGLALGELVQEPDARKLLFVFRIAPTPRERACVERWAMDNHMRAVIIEAFNEPGA